jgi:hypothetical protein
MTAELRSYIGGAWRALAAPATGEAKVWEGLLALERWARSGRRHSP